MHLSLLSDAYLSDSLADSLADATGLLPPRSHGQVHRDGLLRGLLFAAALLLPFGLTAALTPAGHTEAAAPGAAASLRVAHLRMP